MKNRAHQANVHENSSTLADFGARLRQERERLGLNQSEMGALGGVNRGSQSLYETGKSPCGADYLLAIGQAGADICFIVSGGRQSTPLDAETTEFLGAWEAFGAEQRNALLVIARSMRGAYGVLPPLGGAGGQPVPRTVHEPRTNFRAEPPTGGAKLSERFSTAPAVGAVYRVEPVSYGIVREKGTDYEGSE